MICIGPCITAQLAWGSQALLSTLLYSSTFINVPQPEREVYKPYFTRQSYVYRCTTARAWGPQALLYSAVLRLPMMYHSPSVRFTSPTLLGNPTFTDTPQPEREAHKPYSTRLSYIYHFTHGLSINLRGNFEWAGKDKFPRPKFRIMYTENWKRVLKQLE